MRPAQADVDGRAPTSTPWTLDAMTRTDTTDTRSLATPFLVVLLIAASSVGQLGSNMYLPSMPGMARSFGVDFATIQLTFSIYLAAMAIGQLIVGSLSDRYGRRPMLLIGLSGFVLGSVVCLIADDIGVLFLGRILQAVGGCAGITLGRSIVRDIYPTHLVASRLGYISMGMAIPPMIAPTIGGVLDTTYGWRASFFILLLLGAVVCLAAFWKLPETKPNRGATASMQHLLQSYRSLFGSSVFWAYTLASSFLFAAFYAFVAGAPYVMIELMGRSPAEYGIYYAPLPIGYILGNFAVGRFGARLGQNRMILAGMGITLLSVVAMGAAHAAGVLSPFTLFAPVFFVSLGSGMALPGCIAGAVSVKPEAAGAAAGLSGSLQIGVGAVIAPVVGLLIGASVWPLIVTMAICAVLAFVSFGLIAIQRGSSVLVQS
ncbi:MFS permease [Pseudomonas cichorii]|nr:MFS permease [Pseudomonas cichorii]